MFQGKIIYTTRQNLNLTQSQLAEGICTQNTISKLENHNMPPTISILVKICQRLKLTLNDVFTEFSHDPQSNINLLLSDMEKNYYDGNFNEIESKYKLIKKVNISEEDSRELNLINSLLSLEKNELDKASFFTDLIINKSDSEEEKSLLVMIAYAIKGIVYNKKNLNEYSNYYYRKIYNNLLNLDYKEYDNLDLKRLLYLYKSCICFFLEVDKKEETLRMANMGIKLSKENHSSLFVEYFYLAFSKYQCKNNSHLLKLVEEISKYNSNETIKETIKKLNLKNK